MIDLLRLGKSEPLMVSAVAFCLLLVIGLLFSDWSERRRGRRVGKSRKQPTNTGGLANDAAGASTPGESQRPNNQGPLYRVFRWEFLLLAIVSIAVIAPLTRSRDATISARDSATEPGSIGEQGTRRQEPAFVSPVEEFPVILTLGAESSAELPESLALGQNAEHPVIDVSEWRETDVSGSGDPEFSTVSVEAYDHTDWRVTRSPGKLGDYYPPRPLFEASPLLLAP